MATETARRRRRRSRRTFPQPALHGDVVQPGEKPIQGGVVGTLAI